MTDQPLAGRTVNYVQKVALKNGWSLNPDAAFLVALCQGLETQRQTAGSYFCPCRDHEQNRTADRDIICPCIYARPDIADYGQCFCGLFLSQDHPPSEVQSIPDRRP